MLAKLRPAQIAGGINLIDIGASGRLDAKWRPLEPLINLVGFEPNLEECARLAGCRTRLNSARYWPYALAGTSGEGTLYRTKSIYCCSLLEPDLRWLRRFSFGELFEVTGTQAVPTRRLADVEEIRQLDVDAIKIDAQGLELPILAGAGRCLDDAFYVETETGFVQNYHGESTYADVDPFLRARGFLLFDLNVWHRVPRCGPFGARPNGSEQILWCEAVWLRDLVAAHQRGGLPGLTREKALKALLLCGLVGCRDFGWELASLFHDRGLLTARELHELSRPAAWRLEPRSLRALPLAGIAMASRLLSRRARRKVARALERSLDRPDLLKAVARRLERTRRT